MMVAETQRHNKQYETEYVMSIREKQQTGTIHYYRNVKCPQRQ